MKNIFIASLLAASLTTAAQADTLAFTDFVGFGDSLSDRGRLPEGLATQPPQDGSRFSDGPTWMEQVGAQFEARGGANINLALGGATAGTNTPSRLAGYTFAEAVNGPRDPNDPDDIPYLELNNFDAQVDAFLNGPSTAAPGVGGLADTVGHNPLATVLLGGNDFLALPDNPTDAETLAVGASVIGSLAAGITDLFIGSGGVFDDFLVSNLPSFTKSPSLFNVPQVLKDPTDVATQAFNLQLANQMALLGTTLGVSIEIFDLYSVFNTVYSDGLSAGLRGDESCLPGGGVNNCPNLGDSAAYLFLDDIHPNSFIHTGIGNAALAQLDGRIAPVPLPAGGVLLIAALGAFVAMRRRAA